MRCSAITVTRPGFRSVVRARVLERIIQACSFPIALIVAPAGYGKSVALRQHLDTLDEPYIRFDVRPEHNTLPAFVRGFAEAVRPIAPQALASLPDALRGAPNAEDLASWLIAHLEDYRGLIAIDDLHYAGDRDVAAFLLTLIPQVKERIRWIIASRSVPDLPIASWIAYGDMDIPVDERDLAFTLEETRVASYGSDAAEDELSQFVDMTGGWATALSFALRSRIRTNDLAAVGSSTREMVYQYLAEQVYERLGPREREMLHIAAYLPEIDVDLLVAAGFPDALSMLEHLRRSATFLSSEGPGRFRCHDLFRDFLRHHVGLLGGEATKRTQEIAATALLDKGRIADSLRMYILLRKRDEILRLLEVHGFDLADKGHGEIIDGALTLLLFDMESGATLALRAIRESDNGRFITSAELFERAMERSADPLLRAEIATRYALDLFNQGKSVSNLLAPMLDEPLCDTVHAVAASLLALEYAKIHDVTQARRAIETTKRLAGVVKSQLRPRLLHRIGTAEMWLGTPASAVVPVLTAAQTLADKEGLYVTSSAALVALACVQHFNGQDDKGFENLVDDAITVAEKSGNRFSIQQALLWKLDIHERRGDEREALLICEKLRRVATSDQVRQKFIEAAEALVAGWAGNFETAYRGHPTEFLPYNFDRILSRVIRVLYAVALNLHEEASALLGETLQELETEDFRFPLGTRTAEMGWVLCAAAEALRGRTTSARRILARRPATSDARVSSLRVLVEALIRSMTFTYPKDEVLKLVDGVADAGCGGLARTLRAVIWRVVPEGNDVTLTATERAMLQALEVGHSPKEISAQTGRSIHTVRTLIQRATEKLGCSGRQQALAEARRRGLLGSIAGKEHPPPRRNAV